MTIDCTPNGGRGCASGDGDVVDSAPEANLCIRVQGLVGFACVSLLLPPWFDVSAQSSSTLEQCRPPVQANPHPGPLDYCSDISCVPAEASLLSSALTSSAAPQLT